MHKYLIIYTCDGNARNYLVEAPNKEEAVNAWTGHVEWSYHSYSISNIIRLDEE